MTYRNNDHYWMKKCLELARLAYTNDEVPVGAIIANSDVILSKGVNAVEKHGVVLKHAEMVAIEEASKCLKDWRLTGYTLYCSLEPCLACYGALLLTRVSRIVYAAEDRRHGAITVFEANKAPYEIHKIEIIRDLEHSRDSEELLKRFFKGKRNNKEKKGDA